MARRRRHRRHFSGSAAQHRQQARRHVKSLRGTLRDIRDQLNWAQRGAPRAEAHCQSILHKITAATYTAGRFHAEGDWGGAAASRREIGASAAVKALHSLRKKFERLCLVR